LLVMSSLLTAATSQVQPKPLSNKDVIEMVSLGLPDDVIIEKIQSVKATNFDTSVQGLKSLKAAKVSEAVLKAMIKLDGSPTKGSLPKTAEQDNGLALRLVLWFLTLFGRYWTQIGPKFDHLPDHLPNPAINQS